jgi:leucyl-tRNA synthetase
MRRYNPQEIEPKWQQIWEQTKLYEVDTKSADNKFYIIPMFPYPSGDLHVGHWYNFAPTDTVARWHRMLGYKVLQANGFDAFGLPAENAAIKRDIPPAKWTKQNIVTMTKQLQAVGASYDWSKRVITNDPDYYKWTQWLFVKLYEKGLAYRAKSLVNWCPKDQTVLAHEQVVGEDNVCERCGTPVIQKEMEQWFYKTTKYAERLLNDLEKVDWPQRVKTMQENWIGKSKGAEIEFKVADSKEIIKVFTTRPDTLFGATYMVLAPEHSLVGQLTTKDQKTDVEKYIQEASHKTELERKEEKEKTGVFTGAYAINPVNDEKIPIWVADYVLIGYGTGAIMAVPAHDERDWEFAKKFNLPINQVVAELLSGVGKVEFRPGEKVVERNVAQCIVWHPKEHKVIVLEVPEYRWKTLVMGGIDESESWIDGAKREINEETGYKNAQFIGYAGQELWSEFWALHKNENRIAHFRGMEFKLQNLEQDKLSSKEAKKHNIHWQDPEEALQQFDIPEPAYFLKSILHSNDFKPFTGEGKLINSGKYTGMPSAEAWEKIVADLTKKGIAKEQTQYRLRDWLISRQRYWGTPIPVIYCEKCGIVPVSEDQLPVELPENVQFEPTGQSPLLLDEDFVNTKCPKCGGLAKRETDTMDTFVDSSWYFLRYPNPNYKDGPFNPEVIAKWGPVDHYIGGIEHAILHLLYSRFITKFLHDHHDLLFDEPFKKLSNEGMILGSDGLKMSKSKGNVVSPDEQVTSYGSDSLRLYLMFMGPYDQGGSFSLTGIVGTRRFLDRLWVLVGEFLEAQPKLEQDLKALKLRAVTHRTVKKVTQDLEKLDFNTAIAAMMSLVNELYQIKAEQGIIQSPSWRFAMETLTQLLAPFAPHITEELWCDLGHEESVHISKWPSWDEKLVAEDVITIAVQINGKVRAEIAVAVDANEKEIIKTAKADEKIASLVAGKDIKREIYVPGHLVNFVI